MKKILFCVRVVLYLYSFAVFGLMCLGFLPIALMVCALPRAFRARLQPSVRQVVFRGFVFVRWHCRVTGFAKMNLVDHRQGIRSPLLIANHLTMFDIVLLFSFIPEIQTLLNAKFFANPLLRPIILACGYVPLSVENPSDGMRAYHELGDSLTAGETVVMFPEGTRSASGRLGFLKKGPFRMVQDHGLKPSYVFFTCDQPFLNRAAFFPRKNQRPLLEAHIFPPDPKVESDMKSQKEAFLKKYQEFVVSDWVLAWNRL